MPRRPPWEVPLKRWLPFALLALLIVATGVSARVWVLLNDGPARCEVSHRRTLESLSLDEPCVRIEAMAHYTVVVRQTVPGNLLAPERTYFLFPLFPEHETSDRAIRVLVRVPREPERLVSYEFMTLEGRLSPVTVDKVPFHTEIAIGKRSDYFFTDDMLLLEPTRIEADGEVWTLEPST